MSRLDALFRLAFASAPGFSPLTSPRQLTRRLILQEARRQAWQCAPGSLRSTILPLALRLLVSLRFQVLFHSPQRGTFHLSLTVLVHYRSPRVFSLGKWASRLPAGLACPAVLKDIVRSPILFRLRGYHSLCLTFPGHSTKDRICNSLGLQQ